MTNFAILLRAEAIDTLPKNLADRDLAVFDLQPTGEKPQGDCELIAATFLCRPVEEVLKRAAELGLRWDGATGGF
jgi:hypothetical protein